MTQSEGLVRQLLDTAKRAERQAQDDLIALKARLAQLREHRMELEAIVGAMDADAKAIEAQRAETAETGSVGDESAVANGDLPKGA